MSTGRILGRGRVLGSAGPPPKPRNTLPPSSDSSPSLTSSSQSTAQDAVIAAAAATDSLASNVSLPLPSKVADASDRLICPICNEQMVTLLQLNRHIDDVHQHLDEPQQDEVKNWFQRRVDEAKKIPALAVLNQKFKALDVFESNTPQQQHQQVPTMSTATSSAKVNGGTSTPEPVARLRDPEEDVTRAHWQRPSYGDMCTDPSCGKRLGGGNGSINCRKCGRLFCEDHTLYQMKLSKAAQHDPVRGVWCRVCETCYKSREGYNDNRGAERNHNDEFTKLRRNTVGKLHLETSRLEKRLTTLTKLLANPPPVSESENRSLFWSIGGSAKSQIKTLEQSIIAWEDDASVLKCPFCQQEFSSYTFRRHHCRLCGRVVCGDVQTHCSTVVGLNVANEKGTSPIGVDVRMCKDCKHTLFSRADFEREIALKPADQRSYENLVQFERGIRLLLPKFQRLLVALQDPDKPPDHSQISEATKVRKRLTDSFIQYESAARRIRDLLTSSPTQAKLQKAVYQQASGFISLNMLPLKSLPRILKHASPHGAANSPRPNGRPVSALASIKFNDRLETSSQHSGSLIESLETEEKELREKLIVLEEQKFLVTEMLNEARKKRRFEEMTALSSNMDDLTREIDGLRARLSRVEGDFEGIYRELASPVPSMGSK